MSGDAGTVASVTARPLGLSPDAWFASGTRRPYDAAAGRLHTAAVVPGHDTVSVWQRVVAGSDPVEARWITMLPGFPDGSYGSSTSGMAIPTNPAVTPTPPPSAPISSKPPGAPTTSPKPSSSPSTVDDALRLTL